MSEFIEKHYLSKIVFYNPHIEDFFSTPPHYSLVKKNALKKNSYLFDEAIKRNEKINVFIDYTISVFFPDKFFFKMPSFLRKAVVNLEVRKWVNDNNFKKNINFLNLNHDNPQNYIIFSMSRKPTIGNFSKREKILNEFKAVIFHLSHYFGYTQEKSVNLKKIKKLYLCGDSDITANEYFKKYFSWYRKPFFIIPFMVGKRFVNTKPFLKRKDTAVATGSFHYLPLEPKNSAKDFMDFFKINSFHPVREMLFLNQENLNGFVDIHVSMYSPNSKFKLAFKIFRIFSALQKKYFQINIVDLYNDNQFSVIGEEAAGFPGIGALESMACGCVLIAQSEYYNGLGLVPDHHYVKYDGSIEDLTMKIEMLRKNVDFSLNIQKNSLSFIHNFSSSELYKNFLKQIDLII